MKTSIPAIVFGLFRGAKSVDAAITRGSKPVDAAIKGKILMNFLRFMLVPPCGIVVKNRVEVPEAHRRSLVVPKGI